MPIIESFGPNSNAPAPVPGTGRSAAARKFATLPAPSLDWNEEVARGWRFLMPYLRAAEGCVFSRDSYVPEELEHKSVIIPPSIDVFSPKNTSLPEDVVRGILSHTGLVEWTADAARGFSRTDGTPESFTNRRRPRCCVETSLPPSARAQRLPSRRSPAPPSRPRTCSVRPV